eukprot:scaffold3698_cov269-Chaetoceros_neogracile.AAC.2
MAEISPLYRHAYSCCLTGHWPLLTLFMRHVSCMCVTTRQQASPTCQTVIITIFAKPIDQDFRGYALQRHYYPWRSGSPDVFCQSFKIVSSLVSFSSCITSRFYSIKNFRRRATRNSTKPIT